MHIYLLRHGIAEDGSPTVDDRDRALTEEGRKRLQRAAPAWRQLVETPEVVLVSPLRRAIETAAVFREAVRFPGEPRIEDALVPPAPSNLCMNLLEAEAYSGVNSVAVIGHEPHLGYLLGHLLTGHPRQPIPLKKGMLVGVETASSASLIAALRFALTQKTAAQLA
ncbi:MAG TPA: phosphohistidine phosphatase SixA [Planctomycetota bacterium]